MDPVNHFYEEQLTSFLQKYLQIPRDGYTPKGYILDSWIPGCIKFLISEGVFDSPAEVREQAYEDYGILIPDAMMEE